MSRSHAPECLDLRSTVMTMIGGALEISPETRRQNFDRLIRYYRAPLMHYLTAKCRVPIYEADDLVQTFLVKKLLEPRPEQNLISAYLQTVNAESQQISSQKDQAEGWQAVAPSTGSHPKGRFRHYLKKAIHNHFIDHCRKTRRNLALAGLEDAAAEIIPSQESAGDSEFDQVWACNLLRLVIESVRDEWESRGQDDIWFVFYERSLRPLETGEPAPSFEELCRSGRFASAKDASNRYETARRRVKALLRNHVTQYLPSMTGDQINEELQNLKDILLSAAQTSTETFRSFELDSVNSIFVADDASAADEESEAARSSRLGELWGRILDMPISRAMFELSNAPLHALTESACDTSLSLRDLIVSQHPSLPLLRLLKDTAKDIGVAQRNNPEGTDQVLISRVVYALAITLAKLAHNADISSRPGVGSVGKFAELLSYDWLDEDTHSVIGRWLKLFTTH